MPGRSSRYSIPSGTGSSVLSPARLSPIRAGASRLRRQAESESDWHIPRPLIPQFGQIPKCRISRPQYAGRRSVSGSGTSRCSSSASGVIRSVGIGERRRSGAKKSPARKLRGGPSADKEEPEGSVGTNKETAEAVSLETVESLGLTTRLHYRSPVCEPQLK